MESWTRPRSACPRTETATHQKHISEGKTSTQVLVKQWKGDRVGSENRENKNAFDQAGLECYRRAPQHSLGQSCLGTSHHHVVLSPWDTLRIQLCVCLGSSSSSFKNLQNMTFLDIPASISHNALWRFVFISTSPTRWWSSQGQRPVLLHLYK